MASADTNNLLFNIRIIGKNRTHRGTMIAASISEAKHRCADLGRLPTTCGIGGARRIDVRLAHGPLPQGA